MSQELIFDNEQEFMKKLKEVVKSQKNSNKVTTFVPYPIHGLEEVMQEEPSKLKFFTLAGTLTGATVGFLFAALTSWVWPLITSGKPVVSVPPFIVIAFELNILFGALMSLTGFLVLSKLPDFKNLIPEKEYGNKFVIVIEEGK